MQVFLQQNVKTRRSGLVVGARLISGLSQFFKAKGNCPFSFYSGFARLAASWWPVLISGLSALRHIRLWIIGGAALYLRAREASLCLPRCASACAFTNTAEDCC
jgi:hypothetical protein